MKREILFRGKRVDNGGWVEGLLHFNAAESSLQITEFVQTSPTMSDPCGDQFNLFHNINPDTVGQFTGLTDKNGKRIFEGDLVSFEDDPFDEVVYDNTYSGFVFKTIEKSTCIDFYADWLCLREEHQKYYVIRGNVHDNTELS